jgi:ElaB/YqjD/DUF883 family membrane-anchored ribosome-binding protein
VTAENSLPPNVDSASGDGKEAILDDIDRTREQLGETVEALAAKADVKAQAKQKASDVQAQAKQKASEVQAQAKQKAGEVQAQAKQKATKVTGTARQQAGRVAAMVDEHRQPVAMAAAAAAALLVGVLVIRKLRR